MARHAQVGETARIETRTQQRLVADLLDRAFGGSSAKLVVQALAAKPASAEELQEIRQLLAEYKEKDRD